ncbi:HEAT repeat-containing protein 6-like isoform X1 [Ornithodoros turicata]|uniref:HEAT repeat-containing protein 6-like isoform X1 n=1 Tax=Ornithodoros turicata TaxID=34597 RepID=UPI003138A52C
MDIVHSQRALLQECYSRLQVQDGFDPSETRKVLDDLNACNYSIQFINSRDADVLLTKLVGLVPVQDDELVSRLCQLVHYICSTQKVTLETDSLHKILEYIIGFFHLCNVWALPNAISSCAALLYGNVSRAEPFWDRLLGHGGSFETFLSPAELDSNVKLAALKAVRIISFRLPEEPYISNDHTMHLVDLLLGVITEANYAEPILRAEVLACALRCLENIFAAKWPFPTNQLGRLLGILKYHLFYGIPGQKSRPNFNLLPSPLCTHLSAVVVKEEDHEQPTQSPAPKRKNRRRRTKKANDKLEDSARDGSGDRSPTQQQPPWKKASSSESEFSDSEGGQVARLRYLQSCVRRNSYLTLRAIVKVTENKEMFSYLLNFLPDVPVTIGPPQTQTILLTILKDPNLQVRKVALDLLTDFVTYYKPFLAIAADSGTHKASFTPLSATVAAILGEIHRCLHLALIAENSLALIIQLLKCLSDVVVGSPYHRLKPGLLTRLVTDVSSFVNHKDGQIQVASLTALGSVVGHVTPCVGEVEQILKGHLLPGNKAQEMSSGPATDCWLVKVCTAKVLADVPENVRVSMTVVRVEALQVLTQVCRNHFRFILSSVEDVVAVIKMCLSDPHEAIKLHSVKLLEEFSRKLSEMLASCKDEPQYHRLLQIGSSLWLDCALCGTFQSFMQDTSQVVLQTETCNCLASVGPDIWDTLPENRKVLCITLLLGLARAPVNGETREDEISVRMASVRTLGILCCYPSLREDILFLMDVGDIIIDALKDTEIRIKASWTLSNFAETLLELRKNNSSVVAEVPHTFLCAVGNATNALQNDKNQVRANAVRALGCLLYFLTPENIKHESIQDFAREAVNVLLKSLQATLMKVRWNACYAIGSALDNSDLIGGNIIDTAPLFNGLLVSLRNCVNFKVRIRAAAALTVPSSRATYGDMFTNILQGILTALAATEESVDYKELQHQEKLREQLCLSICHLLAMMEDRDIGEVEPLVIDNEEYTRESFRKVAAKQCLLQPIRRAHRAVEAVGKAEKLHAFINTLVAELKDSFDLSAHISNMDIR